MGWRKWKKEDEDIPQGTSVKIDKYFGNLSGKIGKVDEPAAASDFSIVKIAGKRHSFHNSDLWIKTEVFGEAIKNESFPKQIIGNNDIVYKKEYEKNQSGGKIAHYNLYYKGYDIDPGGYTFKSMEEMKAHMKQYVLSNNLYNKYKHMPKKNIGENMKTKKTIIKEDAGTILAYTSLALVFGGAAYIQFKNALDNTANITAGVAKNILDKTIGKIAPDWQRNKQITKIAIKLSKIPAVMDFVKNPNKKGIQAELLKHLDNNESKFLHDLKRDVIKKQSEGKLREAVRKEIKTLLKEFEYIDPKEQKEMKKYYKLADKIVAKVQDKIKTKGAYENAGQNERITFRSEIEKTKLSYQAKYKLYDYINDKIDKLDYN